MSLDAISAVIITKNEAARISRAIKSIRNFVDQVLVVDSGSSDHTTAIAVDLGASVLVNAWPGYAAQRNFGATAAENDWIFVLDADEEADDDVRQFLSGFPESCAPKSKVYAFRRVGDFLGKMLPGNDRGKHVRLYNRQCHKFHDVEVHETIDAERDEIVVVEATILHHGFRSVQDHVQRFNLYTDLEAKQKYADGQRFSMVKFVIKPVARFFYQLSLRGLWRQGIVGIFVALLWVYYDILVQMKLYELGVAHSSKHAGVNGDFRQQ